MWFPMLLLFSLVGQDTATVAKPDTLETVVVRATRAGAASPTSQTILDRAALRRTVAGQDVPLALTGLVGVTSTSDAGGYSGYSAFRLRGLDQTRLTISLDGVPLNDPEDQVLYFSNVPDFLNSMHSVQVQRGVGSSAFGTASFAGSLNFESVPLAFTPRLVEGQVTAGSFGTARASAAAHTGLSRGGFAAYGRVSGQTTNGFRAHAGNDAWSGYFSAGWFGGRDALKFTGFAGRSRTGLAYLAAPESLLIVNRRANPLAPEERDDFHQEMASLRYTRALGSAVVAATVYRNSAGGNYDVVVGADRWNFNLAHSWYGAEGTVTWSNPQWGVTIGGHANSYRRNHFLMIRPDLDTRIYDNTGAKQEQSGFGKARWQAGHVEVRADLEVRRAAFQYHPTAGSAFGRPATHWIFLNPKVGLSWRAGPAAMLNASIGRTSREPSRSDLLAGADDIDANLAPDVLPFDRVRPEAVTDLETGIRWTRPAWEVVVNAFAMWFRHEIAPIGRLTINGTPLRQNVDRSYRVGIEAEGQWRPTSRLTLAGNAAVMRARIAEYVDQATGRRSRDVPPLLSPGLVTNLETRWQARSGVDVGVLARWVGRSQLANDGNPSLVLPAALTTDLDLRFGVGRFAVAVRVANVLDARTYASGYTDGSTRFFFPGAGRSLFVTTTIGAAP